ncbi:MAG: insulinase family protein [Aquificaceae bacterium]|nr:insulinase family protein [Aquificaceae bacterium]
MKLFLILLEVFMMTALALAGELKTYKLPNGAKLVVNKREDTQAVALHVWFRVGSLYEDYQQKGMAHFLEHMLFNGSEKYPYGQMDYVVESLGGNLNAGTSKEYTFYHITIAKPYWRQAFDVLYQLTQRPLLAESMVEKEKPIVIEELRRGKDNPTTLLWEEFEKLAYKVSHYRHPIIGYEETIQRFTRGMLLGFYKSFYQPKNMYVVVVGDLEPEEVYQEALQTFGKEEGKPVPKVEILPEPEQLENRSKTIKDKRLEKTYWLIGWRAPAIGTKEYYALVVLDQILGNGRTSLFYRELREKGLVYGVSTGDLGRPRDNLFFIYATLDAEKLEQVKGRVFELMGSLKQALTEEEFQRAKSRIINSEAFNLERVERDAYYIGYSLTVVGTLDYYMYFENNIRSVRREDVLRVLQDYILSKPYNEVVMVPEK